VPRAGIESGEHTEPSRERLERFLLEWLSTMEGAVRDSTFVAYRSAIRCQAIPLLGRHRLSDLSPAHLSDAYRKLLVDGRRDGKGGLSPATVRYLHVVLRQALQAAVEWGRLGKNPAQFVKPPRVAQPPQRTWDPQQLQRFLVQVRGDRLEALWWVLITTGCRRGEGLGLTWDAIDWQRGRLAIRQSVGRVYSTTVIHEPKTARARRSIGVDPDTLAVLKAHRERQRFERKPWGDAYADHGLVFCREDGRPLRPTSKFFDHAVRQARRYSYRGQNMGSLSVNLVLPDWPEERILEERLPTYARWARCPVDALAAAGFGLLATGRRPHADVVFPAIAILWAEKLEAIFKTTEQKNEFQRR
jgi:integrase